MAEVTEVPPGTLGPFFGGGKGFLIPFNRERTRSSAAPSQDTPSSPSSAPDENPMPAAEGTIEAGQDKASAPAKPQPPAAKVAEDALDRLLFGGFGPLPMD